MKNKCALCQGNLKENTISYEIYGQSIGKFKAQVCESCGERWFDEITSRKIEEKERELGIFGLSKESKISYSGNSLILRIPKELATFMKISKDTRVIIYPENKKKICVDLQ